MEGRVQGVGLGYRGVEVGDSDRDRCETFRYRYSEGPYGVVYRRVLRTTKPALIPGYQVCLTYVTVSSSTVLYSAADRAPVPA